MATPGITAHCYNGVRYVDGKLLSMTRYKPEDGILRMPSVYVEDFDVLHALLTVTDIERVSPSAARLIANSGAEFTHPAYTSDDYVFKRGTVVKIGDRLGGATKLSNCRRVNPEVHVVLHLTMVRDMIVSVAESQINTIGYLQPA